MLLKNVSGKGFIWSTNSEKNSAKMRKNRRGKIKIVFWSSESIAYNIVWKIKNAVHSKFVEACILNIVYSIHFDLLSLLSITENFVTSDEVAITKRVKILHW